MENKSYYNNILDRLIKASFLLDMYPDEVWREIDFLPREQNECRYFISNYGSVISLCRETPIILKPFLCGDEGNQYYCITIGKNEYRLNRLVAMAFIPNTNNKPIVHHKDHNKLNNKWSNLEWATPKENILAYQEYKAKRGCDNAE